MSNSRLNFTEAVYLADAVIQRISPDQMAEPTPCDGWTVRDLIAHMAGALNAIATMARTGENADPMQAVTRADQVGAWNDCRAAVLSALDQPGAPERVGDFWFGESSINDILDFALWDSLVHAWDLATATGQEYLPSEDLVAKSQPVIETNADLLRQNGDMAAAVPVPETATPTQKYLAMTGRNPLR